MLNEPGDTLYVPAGWLAVPLAGVPHNTLPDSTHIVSLVFPCVSKTGALVHVAADDRQLIVTSFADHVKKHSSSTPWSKFVDDFSKILDAPEPNGSD